MCRKGGGGGGGNCYCCVSSCLSSALGVVIVVKLNLKASLLKSAAQPNPIAFLIGFRNENMNSCELSSCEQVVKHDVRPTPTPTPSRERRETYRFLAGTLILGLGNYKFTSMCSMGRKSSQTRRTPQEILFYISRVCLHQMGQPAVAAAAAATVTGA